MTLDLSEEALEGTCVLVCHNCGSWVSRSSASFTGALEALPSVPELGSCIMLSVQERGLGLGLYDLAYASSETSVWREDGASGLVYRLRIHFVIGLLFLYQQHEEHHFLTHPENPEISNQTVCKRKNCAKYTSFIA